MTFENYKDKDGNPLVVKIDYNDSWIEEIICTIYKKVERSILSYKLKPKLVKLKINSYNINTKEINCEYYKKMADENVNEYNNMLLNEENKVKVKKLINEGCK